MKKHMKRLLATTLSMALLSTMLVGCGGGTAADDGSADAAPAEAASGESTGEQRTYYYVAAGLGQSYSYDMIIGLKHAAAQYNCKIVPMGADDWNSATANAALEQAVAMEPDGIITAAWDAGMNPGIEKAMAAGIPTILVEAHSGITF